MLNPNCTRGEVWKDARGSIVAGCGCGWLARGFPSRSAAKRAQREHRFPGENPRVEARAQ